MNQLSIFYYQSKGETIIAPPNVYLIYFSTLAKPSGCLPFLWRCDSMLFPEWPRNGDITSWVGAGLWHQGRQLEINRTQLQISRWIGHILMAFLVGGWGVINLSGLVAYRNVTAGWNREIFFLVKLTFKMLPELGQQLYFLLRNG